jgi:hypothetical protein
MTPLAAAFYETDWFKALLHILIAVIVARVVDSVLAGRDKAMLVLLGRTPDRADRCATTTTSAWTASSAPWSTVLLRLHAWAADPPRRRELAGDLRAALLRRLAGDDLIGAEECGGGD